MHDEKKKVINKYLIGIKNRDSESLELLYELIAPTIRYIALKYMKNVDEADDLVQDFWAEIYKLADNFIFVKSGFSYLCKAITRKALNRLKKMNRENSTKVEFVNYLDVEDYQAEDELELAGLRNDVNNAMLKLSPLQQVIIQKTFFEDKTIRQIANDLNISKSQVDRLKNKAIEILKDELSKKGWDKNDV